MKRADAEDKEKKTQRDRLSYYSSLTKLLMPPFEAAMLSETATMTAGKPVKQKITLHWYVSTT